MAFLDVLFGGSDLRAKHKRRSDARPHHRRRADSSNAAGGPDVDATPPNPKTVEDLRRARTQYLSKTSGERRQDASRWQTSHSRHSTNQPGLAKSSSRVEGRHKTKRKSEGSDARVATGTRAGPDTDTRGYTYVYGPPAQDPLAEDAPRHTGPDLADVSSAPSTIIHRGKGPKRKARPNEPPSVPLRSDPRSEATSRGIKTRTSSSSTQSHRLDGGTPTSTSKRPSWHAAVADSSEVASHVSARPSLARSRTTGNVRVKPPSRGLKTQTDNEDELASSAPSSSTRQPQARRKSTLMPIRESSSSSAPAPPAKPNIERRESEPPPPPSMTDCDICLESRSTPKTIKLHCPHTWCHACLKRTHLITPEGTVLTKTPICCDQPIDPSLIPRILTPSEQKTYNRKLREVAEKSPVYCLTKSCNGRWISPREFDEDWRGFRYAKCRKCKQRVCLRCKTVFHGDTRCQKDSGEKDLLKLAVERGYKRCTKCKILVEKTQGCNHMTCRCDAQFCYKCGKSYKKDQRPNCECALFEIEPGEEPHVRLDELFARRLQNDFIFAMRGRLPPMDAFGARNVWIMDDDDW